MDLLVNLYNMKCLHDDEKLKENGVTIKRALSPDKHKIIEFIRTHYTEGWASETENAFTNNPISCYIAVKNREIVGFASYDATARGYFGPIGLKPGEKGAGIGQSLMNQTLLGMKEAGYGYAVIGGVDGAVGFYEKVINATPIPDSDNGKTIYQTMI